MSEPFIGQIIIFAGNFAPRGWAFCDGQLLPISQNTALFSLVGTTYGGVGRTTLALPNMQGRAPMHPGRGPGLTVRDLGQRGGVSDITLNANQLPSHTHAANATTAIANSGAPSNNSYLARARGGTPYTSANPDTSMASNTSSVGGGGSHNNMQPFTGLNFIIALQGTYPSRS